MRTDLFDLMQAEVPARWRLNQGVMEGHAENARVRELAALLQRYQYRLGTIVAREEPERLALTYFFYASDGPGWISIVTPLDLHARRALSLTPVVIAADWFEREIEDLFSIDFEEHPRLGDFVLHDDQWPENVGLMRPGGFSDRTRGSPREWRPKRVLQEAGAFVMPIGPIYSGEAESALFLLETVGEDVVRAVPRLFYKYRAIEKLAEGCSCNDVLLLVERCAGTSAVGNGLAYCQAVERAMRVRPPPRAEILRGFCAELERVRHHMTSIREICTSTSLAVAASQATWIEEELLRISGELSGHRYFFGVLAVGGLLHDIADRSTREAAAQVQSLLGKIESVRSALENSSSFLDRIEGVGVVDERNARTFELVGPVARASNVAADLRVIQPYGAYEDADIRVPTESEGDGYARLRILFAEIAQSTTMLQRFAAGLVPGPVHTAWEPRSGSGLGWSEAPRGASVQWVCVDPGGTVRRYRMTPPSFRNWHGFHIATEGFAFQDFPIILATLDLSVAENDR